MKIQESGENYLETILLLQNKTGMVRSIDIANELSYTKPSVSRAMSILKKAGLITMCPNGQINLTDEGLIKATQIFHRHLLITKYLIYTLGLDEDTADADACRIEHIISDATFEKIKLFMKDKE